MAKHKTYEENPLKFDENLNVYFPHQNATWTQLKQQELKDLENHVQESMKKQLSFQDRVSMQYFPEPQILAILSDLVYKEKKEIQKGLKTEFPADKWRLFACARNKNGYYGAVFVNSDNTQAIIANRGTQLSDFGDLEADYKAIIKNKHHPQIDSAITFTFFVKDLFCKINPKICISITGHSLGGFLGQVATFVLKYFEKSNNIFEMIPKTADGYHAHCVAFESPGCERMMRKLKDIDFRLDSSISYDHLDISNYVSAPNIFNATNLHIGTVYRLMPDLKKTTYLRYHFDAHKMIKIVEAFKEKTVKIKKVTNWPLCKNFISFNEFKKFFTVAKYANNFDPALYEFDKKSIRYGTEEYDRNSMSPINIFTQQELFLLQAWKHLKTPNLRLEKLEKFVEENKLNGYQYLLTLVEIKTTELTCNELHKLISFIKLIPMFYPTVNEVIKQQAEAEPQILKQLIISESEKYTQQLNSFIQKDITFRNIKGLEEFIASSKVVLQVAVSDTNDTCLVTCWIRNVLNKLDQSRQVNETGKKQAVAKRIYLHWKQLLYLEKFVDLQGIFESDPPVADCIIVEYPFLIPGDERLRKKMLGISESPNIKKMIFVTKMENSIGDFGNIDRSQVGLQFADLDTEWQNHFLETDLLDFENEKFTLGQLLGIEGTSSGQKKNDLVSQKMLKQLLSGNFDPVKVEDGRLDEIDLEGSCEQVYEDVTAEALLKLLLVDGDQQSKLYYFTGLPQQDFFQNLTPITEHQQKIQNLITNKTIILKDSSTQDRFQEVCIKHPDRTIFWFHIAEQSIQCRIIYDSRLYIKRSFSVKNPIFIENEIEEEMTAIQDKFIINQVSIKQNKADRSFPSTVVMVSNEEEAAAEFDKQTNNDSGDNSAVHWIECDDSGRLLWKRSKGNLQLIKRFVDEEKVASVNEAEFIKKLGRVTIITDEPGMGKTTSLASFCRNIRSSWVIRITLRNCQKQITKLPEALDIGSAVHFLQKNSSKLNDDRIRELFRLSLKNDTSVRSVLLFDGFDEIAESAHEKALKLLKFFQEKTKACICITTRKDTSTILENALSIFSIGFQEVTEKEQLSFLSRKWKMRLELNGVIFRNEENEGLDHYTSHLLETTRNVLGKDVSNFMGIPLQLVMLGEVQRPKPEHLSSRTQPFNTHLPYGNILDLYEAFIDKKCDIFFRKMEQNSAMSEMFGTIFKRGIVKEHSHLAMQMLFPESILSKKSIKEDKPFLKTKQLDLNKIGLVQNNDKHFQFVHRTFAEYFVAFFVYKSMKEIKLFEISDPLEPYHLLMEILLQDKYKVIRRFLNDFLSRWEMPDKKLRFHGKQIRKLLREDRQIFFDKENETSLHVCSVEGTKYILLFIFGMLQYQTEDEEVLSFIESIGNGRHFRRTAVHAAAIFHEKDLLPEWRDFLEKHPQVVERVLLATVYQGCDHPNTFKGRDILFNFWSNGDGFLKSCCKEILRKLNVLCTIFQAAKDNNVNKLEECFTNASSDAERHFFMSAGNMHFQTAMHLAANKDNVSALKFLIQQKIPLKSTKFYMNLLDTHNMTPLWHINKEETILTLLEDDVDKECNTLLHIAAWKGFERVTEKLLEKRAEVNFADNIGKTPLIYAAAKGHKKICSDLLDNGADINLRDPNNLTALDHATKKGYEDICSLLLSRKTEENVGPFNKTALTSQSKMVVE